MGEERLKRGQVEKTRRGFHPNAGGLVLVALICVGVASAAMDAQQGPPPDPPDHLVNDYVMAWIETPRMAKVIAHGCRTLEEGAVRVEIPTHAQSWGADSRSGFFAERTTATYIPSGQTYACQPTAGFDIANIQIHAQPPRAKFDDDAVKLDPNHNQVLFENDLVRVVRVHFMPGQSGPIVDKRARVIVTLTDSHATVTLPDGHSETRDAKAGTIAYSRAGRQATKNAGTTPLENIVVELKSK